jgi:wyosine [tRNA(Phe)-imidazoG37] synthetase (radical SAM superfamily)
MRLPPGARYTYGPVPSRRLGRSLGVSIIPRKVCTYSCIYCQLGRTVKPDIQPRSFFPRAEVFGEIERKVAKTSPECITFAGDGEPTLSADLGWFIERCRKRWSIPVAVITNGCLLHLKEIRDSLLCADIVLPSLDAGDEETFKAVNRPHPAIEFERIIKGLIVFRESYQGLIRLEVMLVRGVNDSEYNLSNIRKLAWAIRPDRIDLAVPTRPPAEPWVLPPEPETLIRARKIFRSAEFLDRPEEGSFEIAGFETVRDAVIGLSSRHPLRWDQAKQLEVEFAQPGQLDYLIKSGAVSLVKYGRERFVIPRTGKKVIG